MDVLGIKDKVRCSGLSKNFRKPESEWTPQEIEYDKKMKITSIIKDGVRFYSCGIPWKDGEKPDLMNNLLGVISRQKRTVSIDALVKKGTTIEEINTKFSEDLKKGYFVKVPKEDINRLDCYYLNWFCVIDRTRATTKMRIVFDASAKDKYGKSLNLAIAKGPNLLQDLYTILLKFRMYKWAFSADISEMFLRISLAEKDQKYHRFYWNGEIYQFVSILFGEQSSPDASQKVLKTHCELNIDKFPLACNVLTNFCYMDDTIKSCEDEDELVETILQLIPLTRSMNMDICKFYTNSSKILTKLDRSKVSQKVTFTDIDFEIETSKVLGMVYSAKDDNFSYVSKYKNIDEFIRAKRLKSPLLWTKRLILCFSATAYDPLGLICAFIVRARSFLQDLWSEDLAWDDPIPSKYNSCWTTWLEELFQIDSLISIPRFLGFKSQNKVEIHVFADASTKVFACCAYVRVLHNYTQTLDSKGKVAKGENPKYSKISTSLITAKARVTPTKTESVSRLELAACVIATRMGNAVSNSFNISPDTITYWTDSMNCLYWINTPSSLTKTFVSNRVGEIQNQSLPENWRHVPTDINPADIPTRSPSIESLAKNKLWWEGPEFLSLEEIHWPKKFVPASTDEDGKIEFKKSLINNVNHVSFSKHKLIYVLDPEHYSVGSLRNGFESLIGLTCLVYKCLNPKLPQSRLFRLALLYQIRKAQRADSSLNEMRDIISNGKKSSGITPFIDTNGIIRSHSRLAKIKNIPFDTKFPIILTNKSYFSKLLVTNYHYKFEHTVSLEATKAKIKDMFHIIGLNNCLKSIRSSCFTCKKLKSKVSTQIMSDLPAYRFEPPLRAFSKTGLDFAGPFEVKMGKLRKRLKVYILVITCLQTRALHLEVTEGMDLSYVVNAISRFIDLRGIPNKILSDNFSTFCSKDKDLQSWVRSIDQGLLLTSVQANIDWSFTPPYGPHHGGIYEIMVKATKRALKSLCSLSDLTMDEFRTFVSRVAVLVNSRPLTRVNVDNQDIILTPNHFLLGSLGGAVEPNDMNWSTKKKWKSIHSMLNQFWDIFKKQYIPELRTKKKWAQLNPNLEVGDIVLELDPNVPRGEWRLAIIQEVFPSSDNNVRKVQIKNSAGTFLRPITQLCSLELNSSKQFKTESDAVNFLFS